MPASAGPGVVIGGSSSYIGEGAIGAPDAAPAFTLSLSSNIVAGGANTTAQLTAPAGKTTGDFVAGRIQDDENPGDAVNVTVDDYTEFEWSLIATAAAVVGITYDFRVVADDLALDTYTVTPQMTIAAAAKAMPVFQKHTAFVWRKR